MKKILDIRFNSKIFDKYKNICLIKLKYGDKIKKVYTRVISGGENNALEKFSNILNNYITTMKDGCNNFNPELLVNNLKKTTIFFQNDPNLQSFVSFNNNIINLNINSFNDINHELLHLSSLDTGLISKYLIPINEGYTQLLTERYFNKESGIYYPFEVLFIKNIELIVGKDNLENNYFNGKFFDAFCVLVQYCGTDKMSDLARYMYDVYEIEQTNSYKENYDKFSNALKIVFDVLSICIINKLSMTTDSNERKNILLNCNYPSTIEINSIVFNIENNFNKNQYLNQIEEKRKIKEINQ